MNDLEMYLLKEAKYTPFTPTHFKVNAPSIPKPQFTPIGVSGVNDAPVRTYDRDKEFQMWRDWKASGESPAKLDPIMREMRGIVQQTVNTYSAADIDDKFVRAEAEKKVVEALQDYDPSKGAKLSTHVLGRQKRVGRFVKNHQNFARVVESRAANWSEYQEARKELTEANGRDPSREELSVLMSKKLKAKGMKRWKISASEAGRYMAEDRRDLVHTGLDQDSFVTMPTQDRLVLKMVEEELTPEERAVYERLFGLNGAPKQGPGQIARALKIHPSKVSRLSATIAKKVEAYY
jgi:DNA-directed RNA polymerase specialized sigma subunit